MMCACTGAVVMPQVRSVCARLHVCPYISSFSFLYLLSYPSECTIEVQGSMRAEPSGTLPTGTLPNKKLWELALREALVE